MRKQVLLRDQHGVVLVVALVMLLVLTLIGISGITTSVFENTVAGNERLYNLAFYAADGGLEDFQATAPTNFAFLADPAPSGVYFAAPKSVGGATYQVTWRRLGGGTASQLYQVTSTGTAPGFPLPARVSVEAIVEFGGSTQGYD